MQTRRALIYAHSQQDADRAATHCQRRGYHVVAVAIGTIRPMGRRLTCRRNRTIVDIVILAGWNRS